MRKKRKNTDEGGGQEWLNTYSDMVTLLLCFFVMLLSATNEDAEKWQALIDAFSKDTNKPQVLIPVEGDQVGADAQTNTADNGDEDGKQLEDGELPEDFDDLYNYLKNYISENELQDSIGIEKHNNHVFLRFKDNIFFSPDSSYLKNNAKLVLKYMGQGIKNVEDQILVIKVNGHTATVQDNNYHVSEWSLSSDRANEVLRFFENDIGIQPQKLTSTGYGKNFPIADNKTAEGRSENRRVELVIISNNISQGTTNEILSLLKNDYEVEKYSEVNEMQELQFPQSEINGNN